MVSAGYHAAWQKPFRAHLRPSSSKMCSTCSSNCTWDKETKTLAALREANANQKKEFDELKAKFETLEKTHRYVVLISSKSF